MVVYYKGVSHIKRWLSRSFLYIGVLKYARGQRRAYRFYNNLIDLEHYSIRGALKILSGAADILLHEKDYDGHGWEVIQDCMNTVKRRLKETEPE